MQLDQIIVEGRFRKHLGNIAKLMESIQANGLLQPLVVRPDGRLIAGYRRLEALKRLGWTEIPVHEVDPKSLLRAEQEENIQRKGFTPSEAVAIGRAVEEEMRAIAGTSRQAGQSRGGRQVRSTAKAKRVSPQAQAKRKAQAEAAAAPVEHVRTRDLTGQLVGMSGRNYEMAKAVVEAAERDPERYGDLVTLMDDRRKVGTAYRQLRTREAAETGAPLPPSLQDPQALAVQAMGLQGTLALVVHDWPKDPPNIVELTQSWPKEDRIALMLRLDRAHGLAFQWRTALERSFEKPISIGPVELDADLTEGVPDGDSDTP